VGVLFFRKKTRPLRPLAETIAEGIASRPHPHAHLGRRVRLACRLGLHRWHVRTTVTAGVVSDYHWCGRPGCRFARPMLVNREPVRVTEAPVQHES